MLGKFLGRLLGYLSNLEVKEFIRTFLRKLAEENEPASPESNVEHKPELITRTRSFNSAHFFDQRTEPSLRSYKRLIRHSSPENEERHAYVMLTCNEIDLHQEICDILKKTIEKNNSPLQCFQHIINTLTYYYSRRTWPHLVQVIALQVSEVLFKFKF